MPESSTPRSRSALPALPAPPRIHPRSPCLPLDLACRTRSSHTRADGAAGPGPARMRADAIEPTHGRARDGPIARVPPPGAGALESGCDRRESGFGMHDRAANRDAYVPPALLQPGCAVARLLTGPLRTQLETLQVSGMVHFMRCSHPSERCDPQVFLTRSHTDLRQSTSRPRSKY